MVTLRLSQTALPDGRHRVVVWSDAGGVPREAVSTFAFEWSPTDREELRWYLEDFLEYPLDPAPEIAARVEARIAEVGATLFSSVFANADAQRIWFDLDGRLADVRVEIGSEVDAAALLPWELLRDPKTDTALALQVDSFVRINHRPATKTRLPDAGGAALRVLLVICRPGAGEDVPFRSVAGRLVRLGAQYREVLSLDVLRPPTFAQLELVLDQAHRDGRPYHVVHFDGHGTYVDSAASAGGGPYAPTKYQLRPGAHGYLAFEDPASTENEQLVDGPTLGALLTRTGVSVLLLNACRSAYAEAPTEPQPADSTDDIHAQVRAYGSLALEATDAGLPGVVAMRYNVYVVTAAQFVADLYAALLNGRPLGSAVAAGRRQLAAEPNRSIAFEPMPLQDWCVPVVYEAVPLSLFTKAPRQPIKITVEPTSARPAEESGGLSTLPPAPDVGFFGRDETLLALDRAFDRHRIVLLHAYAGAGKTSTAAEFARWYQATGGLTDPELGQGPVLFSSLEHYTPLSKLLNQIGDEFGQVLQANGIHWQTLEDAQRQAVAIQLLGQVPVLWVWDNVEPVAGFPAGTASVWTDVEQRELADFLRRLVGTRARVLLTSRRDERGWLGDLPARVELPGMPMRERIQLAQALAERHGHRITEVHDWRPLLRYSAGNPLTITVLVGQALRGGLTGREQIEGFVARLRAGEVGLDDDATQGRSRSLGASLSYGFDTAFTDVEQARLAVLHVFQDVVDIDVLLDMGHPDTLGRVAALAGLSLEDGIALLDRAADIGLLTRLGDGVYRIHPALPWYFRRLHTTRGGPGPDDPADVAVAYVRAVAELGDYYHNKYGAGRHEVIGLLGLEEANLLHARALARAAGRWGEVIYCMQGLSALYQHMGRSAEWGRLVGELVPDLVDPATGGPVGAREESWALLTDYRTGLAIDARDWDSAERLQQAKLAWDRQRGADALATPVDQLTDQQHNRIRSIAIDEQGLGRILLEQRNPDCVAHYRAAADLFRRIGARREEAAIANNLGAAYLDIPQLRDLDQAEHWYRHDLTLRDEHNRIGRAQTTAQLGSVAYQRFLDARDAGEPEPVLVAHLTTAAAAYHQALDDLPPDAVTDRAIAHNQLGLIYHAGGRPDTALTHYQQTIKYDEDAGNRYGAGGTRYNIALMLQHTGRITDALAYAHAALRDFQTYGRGAADWADNTRSLIAILEQAGRGLRA